jgi:hypothetical protein
LYFYRARYYDPHSGRFLSEDPKRLRAGNDFYKYVNNNPGDFADPTGLCPTDRCKPSDDPIDGLERVMHALDVTAVNVTFFFGAGGAYVAGVGAIVAGCIEPTPAEPATCAVGIAAGLPSIAGAGYLAAQGINFFKNYTLPAFKNWGCDD